MGRLTALKPIVRMHRNGLDPDCHGAMISTITRPWCSSYSRGSSGSLDDLRQSGPTAWTHSPSRAGWTHGSGRRRRFVVSPLPPPGKNQPHPEPQRDGGGGSNTPDNTDFGAGVRHSGPVRPVRCAGSRDVNHTEHLALDPTHWFQRIAGSRSVVRASRTVDGALRGVCAERSALPLPLRSDRRQSPSASCLRRPEPRGCRSA